MKKLIGIIGVLLMLAMIPQQGQAQNYGAYLGALDTLTNADTTTYTVTVSGSKSIISFGTNVTRISGTVAGTVKLYGSVDGTNYTTYAVDSLALSNSSVNFLPLKLTSNPYQKYKLTIITSGTQVCSQRTYLIYRQL